VSITGDGISLAAQRSLSGQPDRSQLLTVRPSRLSLSEEGLWRSSLLKRDQTPLFYIEKSLPTESQHLSLLRREGETAKLINEAITIIISTVADFRSTQGLDAIGLSKISATRQALSPNRALSLSRVLQITAAKTLLPDTWKIIDLPIAVTVLGITTLCAAWISLWILVVAVDEQGEDLWREIRAAAHKAIPILINTVPQLFNEVADLLSRVGDRSNTAPISFQMF